MPCKHCPHCQPSPTKLSTREAYKLRMVRQALSEEEFQEQFGLTPDQAKVVNNKIELHPETVKKVRKWVNFPEEFLRTGDHKKQLENIRIWFKL